LIKSCTVENDLIFILFGGSGSEIVLAENLKRAFVSCEIHPNYFQMITDRLENKGEIKNEYRLKFIQEKLNNEETEQSSFALLLFE